jgi:Iridoviridae Uvr/REP helicase
MPQTILPISVGQMIIICVFVLIIVFVITKAKGIKGSWTSKDELDPFINHSLSLRIPEEDEVNDSEGEQICRKFMRDTVGVLFKDNDGKPEPFHKARPDFLRNPVTSGNGEGAGKAFNLEIDCYSSKLKLGVEYNGAQHYKFIPHFHKNKEAFRNQQYRDELKRRMCDDNNVTLIEVPYTVNKKDIPSFLYEKLKLLGYFSSGGSRRTES